MGRQGEGGGLKILKNEETSFMDDPLCKKERSFSFLRLFAAYFLSFFCAKWCVKRFNSATFQG